MVPAYRIAANMPTCRCGTDRNSRAATPERDYSFRGALYALWGGTPVPAHVNFRCVHCGVVFEVRSDLKTRRRYVI